MSKYSKILLTLLVCGILVTGVYILYSHKHAEADSGGPLIALAFAMAITATGYSTYRKLYETDLVSAWELMEAKFEAVSMILFGVAGTTSWIMVFKFYPKTSSLFMVATALLVIDGFMAIFDKIPIVVRVANKFYDNIENLKGVAMLLIIALTVVGAVYATIFA